MTPRIIHSLYFKWDINQQLDPCQEVLDHTPYRKMSAYAPDFEMRLWTLSPTKDFCQQYYPSLWEALMKCGRVIMMMDVLRWLIVNHFGGIYWQMSTTPLMRMSAYLPPPNKHVRLFTEFLLTPAQCMAMAAEPIRAGKPEEPIRISNQVFSASPGSPYRQKTIDFLLKRIQTMTPKKDYDVLYISANAAVSEAYDTFGKSDSSIELTDLTTTRRMIKWRYGGSWRKEKSSTPPPTETKPLPSPKLDRAPSLASMYYTWVKPHPHEVWLTQQDVSCPRTSCLPLLETFIEKQVIRTVFEAPCGIFRPIATPCQYDGGDPSRLVVHTNKKQTKKTDIRFRHVNMLYTRFPLVDLFVCPNFLEWLSFAEAQRVLRRILASKPRFLALTGYPLLTEIWDTALGDFRPLNLRLPPFHFPEPIDSLPRPPLSGGRPDRCFMVWALNDLTHSPLVNP